MSVETRDLPAEHGVPCAVLTVSDTRTSVTDVSGARIVTTLQAAGHLVTHRSLVTDDPARVRRQVQEWVATGALRVIITTGGELVPDRQSRASGA